jgi:hypothetical protein
MAFSRGEPFSRKVGQRIHAPTATTTTLAAITAEDRCEGMLCVVQAGPRLFQFASTSAATACDTVIAPGSGSGRWIEAGAGSTSDYKEAVHLATAAALPANTRTGNVLLADVAGALGNIDGVAAVAGRRYLIQNEVAGANNGLYVCDSLGGAGKFQFTRATDADESAEVTSQMLVPVELGSTFAGHVRQLKTTGAITLNTTALTFGEFDGSAAYHSPVADAAALTAIAAVDRADGMVCVQLDTMQLWAFDAGSAAAASDWVTVPAAGTGRWLRTDLLTGATHAPVADDAALVAIVDAGLVDGMLVCKLDDMTLWMYDLGSAAAASDWCQVPAGAVGRWLRKDALTGALHAPVADAAAVRAIAATGRMEAMALVKIDDMTPWGFSATSAAVASNGVIVPTAGTGRWHRGYIFSGMPAQNRLRLLGAPGAAAAGDTVTIGADVYEFRGDTPPTGGDAARIWVYNGAASVNSRTNLVAAINGTVNPAIIANQVATEAFFAEVDHVTVGDVTIVSADAVGGTPCPSATAAACADGLTTVTDIWDNATCRFGALAGSLQHSRAVVTVLAADIAKATLQLHFDFTPYHYVVLNRTTHANMEAITIVGNSLSIALAGGAPPNIQANDVLDVFVSE